MERSSPQPLAPPAERKETRRSCPFALSAQPPQTQIPSFGHNHFGSDPLSGSYSQLPGYSTGFPAEYQHQARTRAAPHIWNPFLPARDSSVFASAGQSQPRPLPGPEFPTLFSHQDQCEASQRLQRRPATRLINRGPGEAAGATMPPGRRVAHTSSLPSAATFIDLTEDDDGESEAQASNPDVLQSQHPYAHMRRHASIPMPQEAEVIDLESDNRSYRPPPFLQPDPHIGRNAPPRQWEAPEIQITGHQILHPLASTSSSRMHSRTSFRHPSRQRPHASQPRQAPTNGPLRTMIGTLPAHGNIGHPYAERIHRHLTGHFSALTEMSRHVVAQMQMNNLPGLLNYENPAFSLAGHAAQRPVAPTIEPLPPARQGFVRAPVEDENAVPVCPNCEMELCIGETELKKQVFAVKGCGHVYCGECAQNRHKLPIRGKGKEPAGRMQASQPAQKFHAFTQCVVDGCTQNTRTKTSMVQIFL